LQFWLKLVSWETEWKALSMPFNASSTPLDLEQRFLEVDFEVVGIRAWRDFLLELSGPERQQGAHLDALDQFLEAARRDLQGRVIGPTGEQMPRECRVFVSHQQRDKAYAERIAYLAVQHQFDYWLDVHDPTLALANQRILPTDPRYGLIIAAIIEMGLLNSTHVIAVHTSNSPPSKWIPYEFGRAKARFIRSTQAAGWFAPGLPPSAYGDYVRLAVMIHRGGDHGVDAWFISQRPQSPKTGSPPLCKPSSRKRSITPGNPLPN
jgi:hypothetical protein